MTLSPRFQAICRVLALLFVLAIVARLAALAVSVDSGALRATPVFGCDICDLRGELLTLAPPELTRAELDRRMLAEMAQPSVQLMLQAARGLHFLPFAALLLSLALALRSLAASGFSGHASRWMRRAALAAVALILLAPAAESLRLTAFSAAIHGRQHMIVSVDPIDLLWSLLVAGAAWTALRALEGALAIRTDLEEIV